MVHVLSLSIETFVQYQERFGTFRARYNYITTSLLSICISLIVTRHSRDRHIFITGISILVWRCLQTESSYTSKEIETWMRNYIHIKLSLKTKGRQCDNFAVTGGTVQTYGTASDDKVVKLTIFWFQCMGYNAELWCFLCMPFLLNK